MKTTLEEEIQREKAFLKSEKEAERKEFATGKPKSGFICEEIEFYQEGVWRIKATLPASFSKPDWFRPGAPAFIQDENWEGKVQISKISPEGTELLLRSHSDSLPELESFSIQPWFSEATFEILEEALDRLESGKFPEGSELLKQILENPIQDQVFSEESSTDLAKFLQDKEYAIIYGPPGTGKTTTLVQAILEWKKLGISVLALAPNNFAVDNLVELGVAKGLNPIRLGSSAKIREGVLPYTFNEVLEKSEEWKLSAKWRKEWKVLQKKITSWKRNFGKEEREERSFLKKEAFELMKTIRDSQKLAEKRVIQEADFVASTFAGTAFLNGRYRFDIVIIDEATQAWTSSCFLAATLSRKLVIAGDPKQLPSFQKSESLQLTSFLEKAISHSKPGHIIYLAKQFRMPEVLMGFSNKMFYEGAIISMNKGSIPLFFNSPLVFIDTAGSDSEEKFNSNSASYSNPTEARFILWLLKQNSNYNTTIITPYSEQANLFHSLISKSNSKEFDSIEGKDETTKKSLTIQTIDSFQGRESDLVILSLVRSNDQAEVGFVRDARRMNVALTRARKQLIVVGDSSTLCQEKLFDLFLLYVKEKGEIKSIFEFDWEVDG